MTKILKRLLLLCALLCSAVGTAALSGCATRGADTAAQYDFGPLPANAAVARTLPPISIADINAPAWLDSPLMFYRLSYANQQQTRPYAGSRWSMPPSQLFDTPRLRAVPRPSARPAPAPVLQFAEEVIDRPAPPEKTEVQSVERVPSGIITGQSSRPGARVIAVLIDHFILFGIDIAVVYFTVRMAGLSMSAAAQK